VQAEAASDHCISLTTRIEHLCRGLKQPLVVPCQWVDLVQHQNSFFLLVLNLKEVAWSDCCFTVYWMWPDRHTFLSTLHQGQLKVCAALHELWWFTAPHVTNLSPISVCLNMQNCRLWWLRSSFSLLWGSSLWKMVGQTDSWRDHLLGLSILNHWWVLVLFVPPWTVQMSSHSQSQGACSQWQSLSFGISLPYGVAGSQQGLQAQASSAVNTRSFAIASFFSRDSEISLTDIQIIERSNCFKQMSYN